VSSSERRASIYLFQGKPSNKASGRIRPFFPASCYYLVTWNSARDSLHATISIHLAVSKHTRTALSDKRRTRLSPAYRNRTTPKAEDYTPLVEYQSTGRESSVSGSLFSTMLQALSLLNYGSAVVVQQITLNSRELDGTFDITVYAFGASWCKSIHSLTVGSCLCIPSDGGRK
jgi:hypothetical protein